MDPRTIPSFTTRLWSEEVGRAEANEAQVPQIAYRFSNGRTFAAIPYDPPVPPPVEDPP
jgi:hypothetical protein